MLKTCTPQSFLLTIVLSLHLGLGAQNTFEIYEIAPMNEFRMGHSMANCGDNRILTAGGWDGVQVTASAEILSVGNEWDFADDMSVPRMDFSMVSLPETGVIVAGGWDGAATNHSSTEIFDCENLTFIAGPELSEGRANLVSVTLNDGRILFCGGFNGNNEVATVDIYDPENNTMTQAADMIYGRSSHSATVLPSGKVLVAGGFNPDYDFQMDQCEVYDPETDTWTEVASLNVARDNFGSRSGFPPPESQNHAMVVGGRMFNAELNLFQGLASAEIYDETADTWSLIELPEGTSYNLVLYSLEFPEFVSVAGVYETGIGVETSYAQDFSWVNGGVSSSTEWPTNPSVNRFRAAASNRVIQFWWPIAEWIVCGGDEENIGRCFRYTEPHSSVEESDSALLTAYPNPTINQVRFSDNTPHDWSLVNTFGQFLRSGYGVDCSLDGLPAGCYLLHVGGENGRSMRIMKL